MINRTLLLLNAIWLSVPGLCLAEVDFNQDIRPILSDNCFHCHGPDAETREAGLRLDIEAAAKADLGGYYAINLSSPTESELLARINADDEYTIMPPLESHKSLQPEEKELLRRWIESGAPYSPPWAYLPPQESDVPKVSNSEWPANWIDHFILDRLVTEDLDPAPPADEVTLVRRLAFDLTGLPPDQSLVDRFAANPTIKTYESIVDELLVSPRFGERMAMFWLDLVRYADTVGYHGDQTQSVWPFRDYVIHSFNCGKPFDQFTIEQLAGDLLPNSDIDDKIASSYNRLLQTSHEGGVQLKEYRSIYLADRVRNVSQVWMGATMGCCQCHDHKFDPLSTKEFYSLGAFFADIDDEDHLRDQYNPVNNRNPTRRLPELAVQGYYQRQRLARLEKVFSSLDELDPEQDAELIEELTRLREELNKSVSMPISEPSNPREVKVLGRGDWQDESGETVLPNAPEALGWQPLERRATRLDLARWLTDSDKGAGLLTARVMANRFWYLMFGEGLARVLDDFGGQGEPPSHPELLDNLALEFAESGWNVKHLLKTIAMSNTYRQSSVSSPELLARDPTNVLLARQGRFRLPAEMVRDAALSASSMLVEQLGGPSVKPYQPAGYYKTLNFPRRKYSADTDQNQWRRGVYVHWQRQFVHPMLKAFDAPSREECTAKRSRSNTSLATLALLNDPTFIEAARVFATNILQNTSTDGVQRIDTIFRRALSRPADEFERSALLRLVRDQKAYFSEHPEAVEELLDVGLKNAPEDLDKVELATWTFACRAVLNLSEMTTRN